MVQQRNAPEEAIDERNRKRPVKKVNEQQSDESTHELQHKIRKLELDDSDGSMENQDSGSEFISPRQNQQGHKFQTNLFGSDFTTSLGGKNQHRVTKKARRNGKKSQKIHHTQSLTQSRIKSLIQRRTKKHT